MTIKARRTPWMYVSSILLIVMRVAGAKQLALENKLCIFPEVKKNTYY